MALPVITAANYNYGAYANPQPVKINTGGGIGEGMLKAASAIGSQISAANKAETEAAIKAQAADAKAKADAAAKQAADEKKASDGAWAWIQEAAKNASEANISALLSLAEAKRDLTMANNNGSISFEDYTKKNLALEKAKQDVLTFGKLSVEAHNLPSGFNIFELKSTTDATNLSLIETMKNSAVGLKFDPEKIEMVASWNAINPSKINAAEGAQFAGNPPAMISFLNKSGALDETSVPLSEIIANSKKFFSINTRFNFADTNENLMKIASEFDSNQGKAYMTDEVNGYMRLNKNSAAAALKGDIQVEAFYNAHGKDIAEDILKKQFNPNDPEQVDLIKTEIANQVLLRARQVGDKVAKESNEFAGAGGGDSFDARNEIKGKQIYDIISNLSPAAGREYTFKFPGEPQSIPFKIKKSDTGYAIQLSGEDWKFITEEEAANMFGQGEAYKEKKQEEQDRLAKEAARALIENTLGTKPKSPFLANFGGK